MRVGMLARRVIVGKLHANFRPSTCKPCSIPLSSQRRDYARQMAALSFAAKARNLSWPQLTAYHRNIKIICGSIRFRPVGER